MLTTLTIAVIVLALFFTIAVGGFTFSLHSSDPAGNGLATAFTAFALIILWIILALLQVLSTFHPPPSQATPLLALAATATFLLASLSQFFSLDALSRNDTPRPLVALLRLAVIAVPLLFITLATWRAFPTIRAYAPSAAAPWTVLAIAAALCIPPCVHKLTTARRRRRNRQPATPATYHPQS